MLPDPSAVWTGPLVPGDRAASLILLCARMAGRTPAAEAVEAALAGVDDWDRFLALCRRNRVAPLVHAALAGTQSGGLPAEVSRSLRAAALANGLAAHELIAQLRGILEALGSAGVDAIPVKGPVLSAQAYGDPLLRPSGDLDILVRPTDVSASARVLLGLGYAQLEDANEEAGEHIRDSRAGRPVARSAGDASGLAGFHWHFRDRHVHFRRPDGGALVELHWALGSPSGCGSPEADGAWDRLQEVPVTDSWRVRTLCASDAFLFACVHGSVHAWQYLLLISDVAALIGRGFDWDEAYAAAGRVRCRRRVEQGLHLATCCLGALADWPPWRSAYPRPAGALFATTTQRRWFDGDPAVLPPGPVSPFFAQLADFDGVRDRIPFIWSEALLPTPAHTLGRVGRLAWRAVRRKLADRRSPGT